MMAKDAGAEYFRLTSDGFEIRFPATPVEPTAVRVIELPSAPLAHRGKVVQRAEGGLVPADNGSEPSAYSLLFKGKAPRLGTPAVTAPDPMKAE